jgi:hypothetical protein
VQETEHRTSSDACSGKGSKSLKLDLFRKPVAGDFHIFRRRGLQGNLSKHLATFPWEYERPDFPFQYRSTQTGLWDENLRRDLDRLLENQW